jgi:cytochrome c5
MSGAAGAPKYGDAVAWAPRIAKGKDALYESTYNGLNGVMPARGTCMDCSDEELQATVDYMVAAAE